VAGSLNLTVISGASAPIGCTILLPFTSIAETVNATLGETGESYYC